MMEVIESTELGAAALQPQRPWVVMSALGMWSEGADGHPTAAKYTPTTYDILCFGLSLLRCVSGYLYFETASIRVHSHFLSPLLYSHEGARAPQGRAPQQQAA